MTSSTEEINCADLFRGDILIIANATAGGVDQGLIDSVCHSFPAGSTQLKWTERAGDATRIAADFAAGCGGSAGTIVVVGGDGSVAEVCSALAARIGDPPAVLVVPAGSGNSTARNLWGELGWREVLDLVAQPDRCEIKVQDLMHLVEPDRVVVLGASTGFLAKVLIEARNVDSAIKGFDRYVNASGAVLQAMPAQPTRVVVDGVELWQGPASSVTVGGGCFRARKFEFLPLSIADDGQLDVCTISALAAEDVGRVLGLVMSGRHLSSDQVRYGRGRQVVIESVDGAALVAEYDGDVWDAAGPRLTIDILDKAIRLVAPRSTGS